MAKKQLDDDLLTGGSLSDENPQKKSKSNKKKKSNKPKVSVSKKTAKIIKSVVCIVVVVALLFAYVATGAVRKGLISSFSIPQETLTGLTITSNDGESKIKLKVATYNYYFAMTYNNLMSTQETYEEYGLDLETYGLDVDFDKKLSTQTTENDDGEKVTWLEYVSEEAIESIKTNYSYYLAAVAANDGEEPEITEDQSTELEETLDEYRETAHEYGYTLSGYLVAAMGKGVTESLFRQEATRAYIAENYQEEYSAELEEKEYTEAEIEAYKEEHSDDLKSVSLKVFECDNEDDAVAFKEALEADGSNFEDLASQYSSDEFYQEAYKDESYTTYYHMTKSALESRGFAFTVSEEDDEDSEGIQWLFSEDRVAGDSYQYSTSVIYVLSPAELSDVKTVNVRHILISPITDEDDDTSPTEATDEQWATALETAQSVLDEWKSGDATEDSFSDLVADNSSDSGSTDTGGLYEDISPTDSYVTSFLYFCFQDGVKEGDTAIIKSDYGYHIMYFCGENEDSAIDVQAQENLETDDSNAITDSYDVKVNWFGSRYFQIDTDIDN